MKKYTISAAGLTVVNAPVTLLTLHVGTTRALEVMRMWISQSANATSAQQRVQVVRQVTAFPTVVSATPQARGEGDGASVIVGGTAGAAGTCGVNASAEGAGAKTVVHEDAFNVLSGWLYIPTPDERDLLTPGSANTFSIYLPVAPLTLTNWSVGLTYRELG